MHVKPDPNTNQPDQSEARLDGLSLTRGRLLAKNTVWNLVGQAAPLILAVFAIPLLIRGLGVDRFGLLSMAWVIVSYFGLFDFGLGRSLTALISQILGDPSSQGSDKRIAGLVSTSLWLMAGLGAVGGGILALSSSWVLERALNIPAGLQAESQLALLLLSASLPFVILTTGLRGVLEAYQEFRLINLLRIPMGIITFAGPLVVLPFSKSLVPVVGVLVIGRVLACSAHAVYCQQVLNKEGISMAPLRALALRARLQEQIKYVWPLITLGGWMAVSNTIGPLMVYFDRFLIGGILSVGAVAYYVTPYEVATKLWILPGAIVGVIFPAFAQSLVQSRNRAQEIYGRTVAYVASAMFLPVLILCVFANDGLRLWLGEEFAIGSTLILQILSIGVFVNSIAHIPYALVQSSGRASWTAKLHMAEAPVYIAALYYLVDRFGVEGAAYAWLGRIIVDTAILLVFARHVLSESLRDSIRHWILCFVPVLFFVAPISIESFAVKAAFLIVVSVAAGMIVWSRVLAKDEREFVMQFLRGRFVS